MHQIEEPYISPKEKFDISQRELPNSEAVMSDTSNRGESEQFVREWLAANLLIINDYTIRMEAENIEIFTYMVNFLASNCIKPHDILLVHDSIPLFLCEIYSFFMVLSSSELSWLKEELKPGYLEQVQSKYSILVKDECYCYELG